jgi:putative peptidoglycan lipid II flippase
MGEIDRKVNGAGERYYFQHILKREVHRLRLDKQGIFAATVVMIIATLLSRLLGVVRETVIAFYFGATAATDAYLVAHIFPTLLSSLAVGSIASTLIPVFTEYRIKSGEAEAWRIANAVLVICTVLLLAGIIPVLFFAPVMVRLAAPGLEPETAMLASSLTLLLAPTALFLGLSSLFTAIMHAYRHFMLPAFSVLAISISLIVSVVAFGARLGIAALAIGLLVGTFLQLVLLFFPLAFKKPLFRVSRRDFSHPGLRKCMLMTLPVLAGTAAAQINMLVDRVLASGLTEGSISSLNFAARIIDLPSAIFTVSLVGAVYPAMAQLATEARSDDLRRTFGKSLRMLWLVIIPAAVGLVVLREPVVRLLFERGAFDTAATQMTTLALAFYAPLLIATAGSALVGRVYFAMQDTLTPLKIGLLSILLNVVLNLILVRYLAHGGLALATSLAATVKLLLLLLKLRHKFVFLEGRKTAVATLKILLAALVMGGSVALVYRQAAVIWGGTEILPQVLRLGSAITVGVLVYSALLALLRLEELTVFKTLLLSRVLRIKSRDYQGRVG